MALLEGAHLAVGMPFAPLVFLLRWLFVATLLGAALRLYAGGTAVTHWRNLLVLVVVLLLAGGRTLDSYNDGAAVIALWVFWLLLLQAGLVVKKANSWWQRLANDALLAGVAGVTPVVVSQFESRFADEEFFVAVQAALVSLAALLLLFACRWALTQLSFSDNRERSLTLKPGYLLLALVLGGLVLAPLVVRTYQASFYASTAPTYPGISIEQPFLCGELLPPAPPLNEVRVDGATTFQALLAAIADSPYKETPDYGLLALGTGEAVWTQLFRDQLLQDVEAARYTGPANSVKWGQHAAALRAYYFDRVQHAFPQLFTAAELAQIKIWFAAINRRALTVEWVDWMYATAFAFWPQGPYENQETGAGLLAILEATGLADPDLHAANREYLARNRRGWAARFRNTDDTYIYQFEWITNAQFQQLYWGDDPAINRARSFEWLLLQVLPNGSPPYYNHIGRPSLAPINYLGASLEGDPHYLWLAAQALHQPLGQYGFIRAVPGTEAALTLSGEAPSYGSCLLYGDSGLPTRVGPLAPDKIVFRDGWTADKAYLLLNLRFSGWHRYKATNAISLLYQGEPIITDVVEAEPIRWLPVGRSLFRDKRIPRENLNGLQLENSGFSAALYWLTGIGSAWAQDPPHAAEVIDFQTGVAENGHAVDRSHTRITDWRGWRHDRWISFYRDGPLVVIDQATGPVSQRAGLTWHLLRAEDEIATRGRIQVRSGDQPLALQLVHFGQPIDEPAFQVRASGSYTSLHAIAPTTGQLSVASLFLPGPWADADVTLDSAPTSPSLRIVQGDQEIVIVLPEG